jgi:exosortase O
MRKRLALLLDHPHPVKREQRARLLQVILTNLVILVLWVWLFRPVYTYLGTIFTRQEFRTNQIVLLAVLGLIIFQVWCKRIRFPMFNAPQLHVPGLSLALGGAITFVLAERYLDINTLSATLFGLATYGLLALWMDGRSWLYGLPAALLLVGALPFGEHMDTFIGYPLRLATARMVSQGLAALGVHNLGVDTILVFENGLSQVDNPCSGVKSLWSGALFLLAATWIEGRPVNKRWFISAAVFFLLLLVANAGRVAVLVITGQVLGWNLLAELLHVPLGVIGFIAACAAALWMLGRDGALPVRDPGQSARLLRPGWLAPVLVISFLALILVYVPPPQPAAAAAIAWDFHSELTLDDWRLDSNEMNWLSDGGKVPVSARRWRFEWRGISGALLLITSDTWRAHHRPERCFTVYGLEVQESRTVMVTGDFPSRWLTMGRARDPQALYSAGYWLQSRERVTDDYSVRIWDDLAPQPEPWVLITVLFDHPLDPTSSAIRDLFTILRQSVQQNLDE